MKKSYVSGISYYLPLGILSNSKLSEEFPEWSVDKISGKTGIYQRHISNDSEFSSDMAISAASKLFDEYSFDKESVDYLLFCTQSPDYLLPTTACILQDKLGLRKTCGALDFNLGCSGFIYGLGLAKGLIESGQADNVLLITSETYSKFINFRDKSNRTIFGDAAAAALISASPINEKVNLFIGSFAYGTDGSRFDKLIVKNSGIRHQCVPSQDRNDPDGNFLSNDDYLFMDGKEIFNFTAFEVPVLVKSTLENNDLLPENISMYIFHQANEFMLDFVRKRCQIPGEKFYISLKDVGNTVSSTIPIALKRYLSERETRKGDKILLAGFGVGLSMGGVVVTLE